MLVVSIISTICICLLMVAIWHNHHINKMEDVSEEALGKIDLKNKIFVLFDQHYTDKGVAQVTTAKKMKSSWDISAQFPDVIPVALDQPYKSLPQHMRTIMDLFQIQSGFHVIHINEAGKTAFHVQFPVSEQILTHIIKLQLANHHVQSDIQAHDQYSNRFPVAMGNPVHQMFQAISSDFNAPNSHDQKVYRSKEQDILTQNLGKFGYRARAAATKNNPVTSRLMQKFNISASDKNAGSTPSNSNWDHVFNKTDQAIQDAKHVEMGTAKPSSNPSPNPEPETPSKKRASAHIVRAIQNSKYG